MHLEFTTLYYLIPLLALLFFAAQRKNAFNKGAKLAPSIFLKSLALVFLALALGRPYLEETSTNSNALLLLDVSQSMDQSSAQALLQKAAAFADLGIKIELLPFASKISALSLDLSEVRSFDALRNNLAALGTDSTSLQEALQGLAGYEGAPVLLISDGQETAGNFHETLNSVKSSGLKIYPLVPQSSTDLSSTFFVSRLDLPLIAPMQKSVDIRATVSNTSNTAQRGLLEITHDKKVVMSREIEVAAQSEALFTAESDPSHEGIKEVRAILKPIDKNFAESERIAFLSGQTREKVLLINGAPEDARFLNDVLRDQAYGLKAVQAGTQSEFPPLSDFTVVILNNAAFNQLPSGFPAALESFVRNGGGLIMTGGNKSFGLGGYKDTVIENILPVKLVPPQTEKKRLNIAVELVLDKSRSMAESSKIEFAKEASKEVIRNLKDEDYIGVMCFDTAPWEVVKLGRLSEIREMAEDRVSRIFATGKTNLMPAIEESRRRLERAEASRKHIIILTDGQLPDASPIYLELTKQLRLLGITVSTVMLGGGSDFGFLRSMAEVGGGAYYETNDPRALPRIFLSDIKVSSGEKTLKEQSEYIVRVGPSGVSSTTLQSYPPLRGYVQTVAKQGADLELVTYAQDKAEPLLASWQYNKGRSIAFTSDANGRWSSFWVSWPKFVTFWSELVSTARGKADTQEDETRFDLRHYIEHGSLVVDLTVYSDSAGQNIGGNLNLPAGKDLELSFEKISRGHFRAHLPNPRAGKYEFNGASSSKKFTKVGFYVHPDEIGEKRGQGFDLQTLQELAFQSGGKINPAAEEIKGKVSKRSERKDLSWVFLVMALITLLVEILLREVFRFRWRIIRA